VIYVSYHAGPGYADEAAGLRESLDALGLEYRVHEEPDRGSWFANCAHKPTFLAYMRAHLAGPIVWLDADARVLSVPDWSAVEGCDLAYHRFRGRETLSGTLYIGDTARARGLLVAWAAAQRAKGEPPRDGHNWGYADQVSLQKLLDAPHRWDVRELPEAYACIDRLHSEGVEPVIWHRQASRRLKRRTG
jgi:hypothetical protein